MYDVLNDLGIRITKSVWPVEPSGPALTGGTTCADPAYLRWVLSLQAAGHEIGYHNASDHPARRQETIRALNTFRSMFGSDPRIGADHAGNLEAVYGGPNRLTGLRSLMYRRASALSRPGRPQSEGHLPTSEYFWGDVLQDRIDYWRNFTYTDLNLLHPCPDLPYHDPARPYVNWWFASTHAPNLVSFLDLLDPERLDRLEEEGGACIVYTHFGVGFAPDGTIDPRFVRAMEALAARPGWFVPASTLLDHLRDRRGHDAPLSDRARARLERRWILDHVRARGTSEVRRAIAARRR